MVATGKHKILLSEVNDDIELTGITSLPTINATITYNSMT